MASIDKSAITTYFMNNVVTPAAGSVVLDDTTYTTTSTTPLVDNQTLNMSPATFTQVSHTAGYGNVPALADIFIGYAYHLTSIRRATLFRWDTVPAAAYTQLSGTGDIASLDHYYRDTVANFQSGFSTQRDALDADSPQGDLETLIDQIGATVTSFRTGTTIQPIYACHNACHASCHSSCHGACHGSRGRR